MHEAHRATATVFPVTLALSLQTKRLDPTWQADIHDEGIRSMVDWTTLRQARRSPSCLSPSRVSKAAQRTDEEGDVVMETL
jgi:hypothetical protein